MAAAECVAEPWSDTDPSEWSDDVVDPNAWSDDAFDPSEWSDDDEGDDYGRLDVANICGHPLTGYGGHRTEFTRASKRCKEGVDTINELETRVRTLEEKHGVVPGPCATCGLTPKSEWSPQNTDAIATSKRLLFALDAGEPLGDSLLYPPDSPDYTPPDGWEDLDGSEDESEEDLDGSDDAYTLWKQMLAVPWSTVTLHNMYILFIGNAKKRAAW